MGRVLSALGASIDAGDVVTPGVHGSILFGAGNNVTSFSQLAITYSAPLPVELTDFGVRLLEKNTARLHWLTAQEKNSKGFEIQWMQGAGGSFAPVGFVPSKGSSSQSHDYAFDWTNLADGAHYFRLKQLDNDGTFQYSPVKSVVVQAPFSVSLSPNPVHDVLNVQVSLQTESDISISLVNKLGQVTELITRQAAGKGASQWHFDLSKYPAGVYYCGCKAHKGLETTIQVVKN